MRRTTSLRLALAMLLSSGVSCASCLEQPATEVTFRLHNGLDWPVYLRDEFHQAGLAFQRDEGGFFTRLTEFAESSCDECAQICRDCNRALLTPMARRLLPGETFERVWSGEFREEQRSSCLGRSVTCLGERAPAQPGVYRVQFCWAASLPTAVPDQDRFRADFPAGLTCTTREFELPAGGPVEVTTEAPPACSGEGDCAAGQLCLDGRCSASCLPNQIPALGGAWNVEVGSPDDAGFFEVEELAGGSKVYRGTGRVGAVRYQAATTLLTLAREADGFDLTASFYFALPQNRALPLEVGAPLEALLVDRVPAKGGRAVVLRRDGRLLLAADTGRGGPSLEPGHLAPFSVPTDGPVFACNHSDCGRRTHRRMGFELGASTASLEPGEATVLFSDEGRFEVVAVGNYANEVQGCGPSPMTPFLLMKKEDSP